MALTVESGADARGQVEQHPGGKAGPGRVRGGRVHAVVRGDAHHVDLVHAVAAQPVAQRRPVVISALESAVRRGVLPLAEYRLHRRGVQVRVEVRPGVPATQCGGQDAT